MKKSDLCVIYAITCIANGKCYIGQSANINQRWKDHKSKLKRNKHYNKQLQLLYNEYGEQNITLTILEECSIEELDSRERYWIDYYGGVDSNANCNLESGGHKNKKYSQALKKLQSESHKGQHSSPETQFKKGQTPWNKGKKATDEARKHQSESHKGLKMSDEAKAKLSAFWKGRKFGTKKGE
jgi:group I intron endonuclease